jgi:hypothetical protein
MRKEGWGGVGGGGGTWIRSCKLAPRCYAPPPTHPYGERDCCCAPVGTMPSGSSSEARWRSSTTAWCRRLRGLPMPPRTHPGATRATSRHRFQGAPSAAPPAESAPPQRWLWWVCPSWLSARKRRHPTHTIVGAGTSGEGNRAMGEDCIRRGSNHCAPPTAPRPHLHRHRDSLECASEACQSKMPGRASAQQPHPHAHRKCRTCPAERPVHDTTPTTTHSPRAGSQPTQNTPNCSTVYCRLLKNTTPACACRWWGGAGGGRG